MFFMKDLMHANIFKLCGVSFYDNIYFIFTCPSMSYTFIIIITLFKNKVYQVHMYSI